MGHPRAAPEPRVSRARVAGGVLAEPDARAMPEQFAAIVDGVNSDSGALHDLVADPATDSWP